MMFQGLDEVGNKPFAEWVVELDHTGSFVLGEGAELEATGRHRTLEPVSTTHQFEPTD